MLGRKSLVIVLLISIVVQNSVSFELDNVGRAVRNHLGTLYNLRNKLSSGSTNPSAQATSSSPPVTPIRKESRGYSFHYSPSEVTNPVFPVKSYSASHQFQSRMGKIDEPSGILSQSKSKTSSSKWEKYNKNYKKASVVNSFNVHQKNILPTVLDISTVASISKVDITTKPPTPPTTSTSATPVESKESIISGNIFGPIQSLGQGLNNAMMSVLTEKLMNILDQDVPQGIFTPLKHLVATGNQMVDHWDKRANARDGKSPGIVEILGYGLDQLKKYRDGKAIKPSDPVANLTSPSKTLIQGMLTVKRLTNRVLGYDTTNDVAESRGGYGHDSYGHGGGYGHSVSYGGGSMYGGLDPFSLLAALAFGAFLLQLLLTLLNTSARSLNVVDINTPLMMSDFHLPTFMTSADKLFGTPTIRNKREATQFDESDESGIFYSIVDKLDGAYKTYREITEKPKCAKLHICRLAVDDAFSDESSILAPLYMYGLGHLAKDKSTTHLIEDIKKRVANGEEVNCEQMFKECLPKEKRRKAPGKH